MRYLALVGVSLSVMACVSEPPRKLTATEIHGVVGNWLRCDECWNRQLAHVVMMGDQAIPILQSYIDNTAPPLVSDADLTLRYEASYDRIVLHLAARGRRPLVESKFDYVQRHKRQYRNAIRSRAALVLAKIDDGALPADFPRSGIRLWVEP